ncbi:MAG: methylthioribulose 1-phosphate dehydratase [Gammaproteobacteria bacterium]|nr:methylthioribulose 1-phosphate dehydratase [Gammaproteobacteria bacterium]
MDHLQGAFYERAAELIAAGQRLYERGWLPATSGNLSARLDPSRFAITVSGAPKGALTNQDIMAVNEKGHALEPGVRPSAETLLHVALYLADPAVAAVLHVHSPGATVLSLATPGDHVRIEGYELIKAFPGHASHDEVLDVPIFDNDQHIPRLVEAVRARLGANPAVPGYLIRGHGLYAWGPDIARTMHYLEAFDFLFNCQLQMGASQP